VPPGYGPGHLLTGIAAAQLAGEYFVAGLDRQREDVAGQEITPVPGLSSTTAAPGSASRGHSLMTCACPGNAAPHWDGSPRPRPPRV
jgi:hypothetical protein